jgi:hypothetical protein
MIKININLKLYKIYATKIFIKYFWLKTLIAKRIKWKLGMYASV